jgi:Polyketide cyclase / dehydrase and lipid transport
MWAYEHITETDLRPEAIWGVLADLDNWTAWDTSMEAVTLDGPFAVGSKVTMVPKGQDPVTSVIIAITENELYADRMEYGGLTLSFSHTLTRLPDGGTRVTHRLEIVGDGVDELGPELGSMITEDFPEAMAALLAYAAA